MPVESQERRAGLSLMEAMVLALVAAALVVVGPASDRALASGASGGNASGSFTLTVPDTVVDNPWGATAVPVSLSWTGIPTLTVVIVKITAFPLGSSTSDDSLYEYKFDTPSGSISSGLNIYGGPGPYSFNGYVEIGDYTSSAQIPVSGSFTLTSGAVPVALTAAAAWNADSSPELVFSGKATVAHPTLGVVGADGDVAVQRWDGANWVRGATGYTNEFGDFSVTLYGWEEPTKAMVGSLTRVVFIGTDRYQETYSPEILISQPPASVSAAAIVNNGKLWVDVDPNSVRWTFRVQKQKANGAWKRVGTYKTKGSLQTRVINLRKGTYRVVVIAKAGFAGSTSAPVTLRR